MQNLAMKQQKKSENGPAYKTLVRITSASQEGSDQSAPEPSYFGYIKYG